MKRIDLFRINNNSRTQNTIYNFVSSIGGQLIAIIMQFLVRTVFIYTLGKAYLGISGLFSNILTMLSLAEFGVGSAIVFKLYDPIAQADYHRITVLMKLYQNLYRVIGLVVFALGLSLLPLLPKMIKDYDRLRSLHINVLLIYFLYLLKSALSYLFFAYKSAIIKAYQKEYLINVIGYLFTFGLGIIQIVFLLIFRNFDVYVITSVIEVVIQNIVIAKIADKMFPFINDYAKDKVPWIEIKDIFKDCGALFLYNLNSVVVKATDNIVLSFFLGLEAVGLYSNYYILYTTIRSIFYKIFNSVLHSLGNLHVTVTKEHEYEVFEIIMLFSAVLGGTAFSGIMVVSDDFIGQWIGREWIIVQPFAFLMGLELFTAAFKSSISQFRTAMGLFQQAKYRPVAGMIINLLVSVALVKIWGICGVLVGTIASDWLTFMWYDPLIIHKYGFENMFPVMRYYRKFLKYFVVSLVAGGVDYFICRHCFNGYGWVTVIIHAVICGMTVPAALYTVSFQTKEGQYVMRMGQKYAGKILRKLKAGR